MNVISFDLVQKNPIFRFFGTFNRPKTPKLVPQKLATLFFGLARLLTPILHNDRMISCEILNTDQNEIDLLYPYYFKKSI